MSNGLILTYSSPFNEIPFKAVVTVPGPGESASPGNSLERKYSGPKLTEVKTLGMGLSNLSFNKFFR